MGALMAAASHYRDVIEAPLRAMGLTARRSAPRSSPWP